MKETTSQAERQQETDVEMADYSKLSPLEGQLKAEFVFASAPELPCLAIAGNGERCIHSRKPGYVTCRIPEHRDQEPSIQSSKPYGKNETLFSRPPSIQRSTSDVRLSEGRQPSGSVEGSRLDHLDLHTIRGQSGKSFGDDANEHSGLRNLWTADMKEALEYADGIRTTPAQLRRLQQAVMHNQNRIVDHDSQLEQLGQAFSAFELDNALRTSEFMNSELGSVNQSIKELQGRHFPTANSQALEDRIHSLIAEEAHSFARVTEKQGVFDDQLRQLFEKYGQLRMEMEQQTHTGDSMEKTISASSTQTLKNDLKRVSIAHNVLATHVEETNDVNTKRLEMLRRKHLELEKHTKNASEEIKVVTNRQADQDSRLEDTSTEVKGIVRNIGVSDSKYKELKKSLDIQEQKIDRQTRNLEKTHKELEALREEMAGFRSGVRSSNKARSVEDHQAKQSVPRQDVLAQVSHTDIGIVGPVS